MIGKVEATLHSFQKVHQKTNDEKAGGNKNHENSKEDKKDDEVLLGIAELTEIVNEMNSSDIYKAKEISFELVSDKENLSVNVKSASGKIIQHLNPTQTKTLHTQLISKQNAAKGGLLNVSC